MPDPQVNAAPRLSLPTVKVRCLRPFYIDGRALKIGDVADVSRRFARELEFAKKAEILK